MGVINFTFKGQLKSGKNAVQIDPRSGRHYPKPEFKAWRQEFGNQLMAQGISAVFDSPASVIVSYTPGDRRRRDAPGMLDAIFNVLEYFAIVKDDSLFEDVTWITNPVEPGNGSAKITIESKS